MERSSNIIGLTKLEVLEAGLNELVGSCSLPSTAALEISVVKNQSRPLGVIVDGYLKDDVGNGIIGKAVSLWESTDNGTSWDLATGTAAGNPLTTAPTCDFSQNGYYLFDVDVPQQGTYPFATTFAGDSGYSQATNAVVGIQV